MACQDLNIHMHQNFENLLIFQLFYYESISVEGPSVLASGAVPYLSSWGEEEITEREKRERELGGYGCGEVIDI